MDNRVALPPLMSAVQISFCHANAMRLPSGAIAGVRGSRIFVPAKAEAEATVTNNSPHVTNRLAFIYSLSGVIVSQRAGRVGKGGSDVARAQARARNDFVAKRSVKQTVCPRKCPGQRKRAAVHGIRPPEQTIGVSVGLRQEGKRAASYSCGYFS